MVFIRTPEVVKKHIKVKWISDHTCSEQEGSEEDSSDDQSDIEDQSDAQDDISENASDNESDQNSEEGDCKGETDNEKSDEKPTTAAGKYIPPALRKSVSESGGLSEKSKRAKIESDDSIDNSDIEDEHESGVEEEKPSGEWEDIYGRKRDSKGNVIPAVASDPTEAGQGGVEGASKPTKYVPPAMRNLGGGRYGH